MDKNDIEIRLTEIQAILENNLYENEIEEADLMNERDYLEKKIDYMNDKIPYIM